MRPETRRLSGRWTMVTGVAAVCAVITLSGQYNMTVNQDRLRNAQNEPQNWLMVNGDYASTRYSKLTQINRTNVKDLRLVWAMALGGMQDVGQNGPETEMHPLVDNVWVANSQSPSRYLGGTPRSRTECPRHDFRMIGRIRSVG